MSCSSIDAGILDPGHPSFARHRGLDAPIEHGVVLAAAAELDVAVAIADVFRSDPAWWAPDRIMVALAEAFPTLITR